MDGVGLEPSSSGCSGVGTQLIAATQTNRTWWSQAGPTNQDDQVLTPSPASPPSTIPHPHGRCQEKKVSSD